MRTVRIGGAGLAGCAAAISAIQSGAKAVLWDPSHLPKHKVCGEFLTPEIGPVLRSLGLWDEFLALRPATMTRMRLFFGDSGPEGALDSPAYGLSRYQLDQFLRNAALRHGAQLVAERADPAAVDIIAHGRQNAVLRGQERIFGFKAHFTGSESDAVELYFFNGFYVGVNPVEGGVTNVCGIGPESGLRSVGFDYSALLGQSPALAERVAGLKQLWKWQTTGPVVHQSHLGGTPEDGIYRAGDALQFVDPFTGTGMTVALWTGALAGEHAAKGLPVQTYLARAAQGIAQQYHRCSMLRLAMNSLWIYSLARKVPVKWLYRFTRPKVESR